MMIDKMAFLLYALSVRLARTEETMLSAQPNVDDPVAAITVFDTRVVLRQYKTSWRYRHESSETRHVMRSAILQARITVASNSEGTIVNAHVDVHYIDLKIGLQSTENNGLAGRFDIDGFSYKVIARMERMTGQLKGTFFVPNNLRRESNKPHPTTDLATGTFEGSLSDFDP